MTKSTFAFLAIAATAFTCSDIDGTETPTVPFSGEWVPVYYTLEDDKTEYLVQDCKDNITSFSKELDEFISGNLLIGDPKSIDQTATGFRGTNTWSSRCDANYHYDGIWSTPDRGATVIFESTVLPDSTLQFKCLSSSISGTWKFRYEKGEESLTINYKMKRN